MEAVASADSYQHAFAKATLGPELALRYLSRYVVRLGFSNQRLVAYDPPGPGRVVYRTKHGEELTCTRAEFVARFARHVLPQGFHRVRRYGLLAPRGRKARLERARAAIAREYPEPEPEDDALAPATSTPGAALGAGGSFVQRFYLERGVDLTRCPRCRGRLRKRPLRPVHLEPQHLHARLDSS